METFSDHAISSVANSCDLTLVRENDKPVDRKPTISELTSTIVDGSPVGMLMIDRHGSMLLANTVLQRRVENGIFARFARNRRELSRSLVWGQFGLTTWFDSDPGRNRSRKGQHVLPKSAPTPIPARQIAP